MSVNLPAFFSHVKDNLPVWVNLPSGGLNGRLERGIPSLEMPVRPGDVVRWLRVQQGFSSQQALAKRAGVGRDTVRKIEAGIRTKEDSRDLVAQALGRTWQAIEAEAADAGADGVLRPPFIAFHDGPAPAAPDVMTAIAAMVRRVDPGVQERMFKAVALAAILAMARRAEPNSQERMLKAVALIYAESRDSTALDPRLPALSPAAGSAGSLPRMAVAH